MKILAPLHPCHSLESGNPGLQTKFLDSESSPE